MTKYRTIVADPPWPIKWTPGSDKIKGGAWWNGERVGRAGRDMAYETMSVDAIGALNVGGMAEDKAALFLWSTRKLFREGTTAAVAREWGFEPCGEIIWGLRSPGLGTGAFRNDHEPVLVARRGGATFPSDLPRGVQFWKQMYEWTGKAPAKVHSAKPESFYDVVEQISPGPYVELFARRARLGWDYWGDQSLGTAEMAGGEAA